MAEEHPVTPGSLDEPTTTFADAMGRALAERGIGLSETRRRLAERGVRVGLATLSQWRSGTRRPHGPGSLTVVGALEDVLGTAPNALWDLIEVPLPLGQRIGNSRRDRLIGTPPELAPAIDALGVPSDDVDEVGASVVLEVGRSRCVEVITTRHVVRANRSGAQRAFAFLTLDEVTGEMPRWDAVSGCSTGATVIDRSAGVAVVELILPAPLPRNGTTTYETRAELGQYDIVDGMDFYAHVVSGRAAQVLVEIRFPPTVSASAGETYLVDGNGREYAHAARPTANLHNIAHNFGPGQVGVRWWWDQPR